MTETEAEADVLACRFQCQLTSNKLRPIASDLINLLPWTLLPRAALLAPIKAIVKDVQCSADGGTAPAEQHCEITKKYGTATAYRLFSFFLNPLLSQLAKHKQHN